MLDRKLLEFYATWDRPLIKEMAQRLLLLTDPAAVHANILRGELPLTKAQAIHIAGLPADIEQRLLDLQAAAQAVIDQWETPNWKLTQPTGDLINRLRNVLNPPAPAQEDKP